MILNVSHNDPEVSRKINELLGPAFSLRQRITMRGIGSPPLIVTDASTQIKRLLALDNNRNITNIELRPKGIIIGFRSRLESYALPITYHQLFVENEESAFLLFQGKNHFIKILAPENDTRLHTFIHKLKEHQTNMLKMEDKG